MLIVRTTSFFAISNCIWQKNGLENGQFSLFLNFQKSLTRFDKYLCDKFSKFKNLRCTFFSFVHANSQDNFFFCHIWQKNGLENDQFSLFLNFQKSLNMFDKNLCDKFSKIKTQNKIKVLAKKFSPCRLSQYMIFCHKTHFCGRYSASDLRQTGGPCVTCSHFCTHFCSFKWHSQACIGLVCTPARFARWGAIIHIMPKTMITKPKTEDQVEQVSRHESVTCLTHGK